VSGRAIMQARILRCVDARRDFVRKSSLPREARAPAALDRGERSRMARSRPLPIESSQHRRSRCRIVITKRRAVRASRPEKPPRGTGSPIPAPLPRYKKPTRLVDDRDGAAAAAGAAGRLAPCQRWQRLFSNGNRGLWSLPSSNLLSVVCLESGATQAEPVRVAQRATLLGCILDCVRLAQTS
jgi:hypothetical protein